MSLQSSTHVPRSFSSPITQAGEPRSSPILSQHCSGSYRATTAPRHWSTPSTEYQAAAKPMAIAVKYVPYLRRRTPSRCCRKKRSRAIIAWPERPESVPSWAYTAWRLLLVISRCLLQPAPSSPPTRNAPSVAFHRCFLGTSWLTARPTNALQATVAVTAEC